jgi:hypothetical protein
MVTTLKYGSDKQVIKSILERLKKQNSRSGFDAYKFCGVISLEEEPLKIQKNMRDEWQ